MKWTSHRPFVPPALLDRLDRARLRRAALGYAAHGWPVTPGARLIGHRFHCDRPGCPIMMCHPALESWQETASVESGRIGSWWRLRPYTVLLTTGEAFDALEVPAALGLRALGKGRLLGAAPAPVTVTGGGRWTFLMRPGTTLRPELEQRIDIVLHGRGSWIPAPPSRLLEGPVRWAVAPEETGWRLPPAADVQELLADALGAVPATPPITVPRQLTTARRHVD